MRAVQAVCHACQQLLALGWCVGCATPPRASSASTWWVRVGPGPGPAGRFSAGHVAFTDTAVTAGHVGRSTPGRGGVRPHPRRSAERRIGDRPQARGPGRRAPGDRVGERPLPVSGNTHRRGSPGSQRAGPRSPRTRHLRSRTPGLRDRVGGSDNIAYTPTTPQTRRPRGRAARRPGTDPLLGRDRSRSRCVDLTTAPPPAGMQLAVIDRGAEGPTTTAAGRPSTPASLATGTGPDARLDDPQSPAVGDALAAGRVVHAEADHLLARPVGVHRRARRGLVRVLRGPRRLRPPTP